VSDELNGEAVMTAYNWRLGTLEHDLDFETPTSLLIRGARNSSRGRWTSAGIPSDTQCWVDFPPNTVLARYLSGNATNHPNTSRLLRQDTCPGALR
jgi:hypothetical protein